MARAACTKRRKFWVSDGLCGTCSGRPKSHKLDIFQGIAFRTAESPTTPRNPTISESCCCFTPSFPALKLSTLWQRRDNSSRTSSSSLCDGHGRCFCVCMFAPCFRSSEDIPGTRRNEHVISRAGQLIGCCAAGRCKTHASSEFQKQLRSHGTQQNDSSCTTALALEALALVSATFPMFVHVQCSPGDDSRVTTFFMSNLKTNHTSPNLILPSYKQERLMIFNLRHPRISSPEREPCILYNTCLLYTSDAADE